MDLRKLNDDLREAFAQYQYNLDFPFPNHYSNMTATQVDMNTAGYKYMTDAVFHAKVDSLVAGVLHIVQENS